MARWLMLDLTKFITGRQTSLKLLPASLCTTEKCLVYLHVYHWLKGTAVTLDRNLLENSREKQSQINLSGSFELVELPNPYRKQLIVIFLPVEPNQSLQVCLPWWKRKVTFANDCLVWQKQILNDYSVSWFKSIAAGSIATTHHC